MQQVAKSEGYDAVVGGSGKGKDGDLKRVDLRCVKGRHSVEMGDVEDMARDILNSTQGLENDIRNVFYRHRLTGYIMDGDAVYQEFFEKRLAKHSRVQRPSLDPTIFDHSSSQLQVVLCLGEARSLADSLKGGMATSFRAFRHAARLLSKEDMNPAGSFGFEVSGKHGGHFVGLDDDPDTPMEDVFERDLVASR